MSQEFKEGIDGFMWGWFRCQTALLCSGKVLEGLSMAGAVQEGEAGREIPLTAHQHRISPRWSRAKV